MTDRERGADLVGKVLDELAEKISVYSEEWDGIGKQSCLNMLEERLGPLLRAGQAMRDDDCMKLHSTLRDAWDAALATLEGRDGK